MSEETTHEQETSEEQPTPEEDAAPQNAAADAEASPTDAAAPTESEQADAPSAAPEASGHDAPEDAPDPSEDTREDAGDATPGAAADEDAAPEADTQDEVVRADDANDAEAAGDDATSDDADADGPARRTDVTKELRRLVDLTTKYPEIGAPLAQLATKLGHRSLADKLLDMGLEEDGRGVEFYSVAANLARKEGRPRDVLNAVSSGLSDFIDSEDAAPDVKTRLLHLIRLGFAVVMFDLESMEDASDFTTMLAGRLPEIKSRFAEDAFYHSLLAQALWFTDREASEAAWEEAVALGDAETSWNARGTWYKEAEEDLARAEGAYRSGLKSLPTSVLLLHNLAQVLMDRAEAIEDAPEQKRNWLNEAESLLRQAHRRARRHSMRRHINGNIERVKNLQKDLPRLEDILEPPSVGDVVTGRVNNIKPYGAFVSLDQLHSGLVHKSEIAHEFVKDPADYVSTGEDIEVKVLSVEPDKSGKGLRIGLSRKALLEKPEGAEAGNKSTPEDKKGKGRNANRRRNKNKGKRRDNNRSGGNSKGSDDQKMGSLGELLMAKLEQNNED